MSGWDGNLIEFEDKVIYICDRGRKFQDDFDQLNVEATCKPEYTWDLPVWGQCIESKINSLHIKLIALYPITIIWQKYWSSHFSPIIVQKNI